MARREKDLQNGMNSMMGYATQAGQNKTINSQPEQTAAVQTAPQITPQILPEQNESNEQKKAKYLRLDITGLEDYVSLMAEHLTNTSGYRVSMTKYIRQLIEADKQQNSELFEKLMQINEQIDNMKRELI